MNSDMIAIYVFIVGVYLVFGFLLSIMAMGMMDGDADDYLFAFLMFWPIALITVSVFQLIHFIKRVFKGKY
mgnify:CR=1 FL=1